MAVGELGLRLGSGEGGAAGGRLCPGGGLHESGNLGSRPPASKLTVPPVFKHPQDQARGQSKT